MRRSPWATLAVLALAQFIVVLDVTIVNVALPNIQADLNFSADNLQWVINAYTLLFGGFLLLGGRMSDLLGPRRVFVAGLLLFGATSLIAGLSNSPEFLIGARAVQGLGGALLSPAALAILTVTFAHGRERGILHPRGARAHHRTPRANDALTRVRCASDGHLGRCDHRRLQWLHRRYALAWVAFRFHRVRHRRRPLCVASFFFASRAASGLGKEH